MEDYFQMYVLRFSRWVFWITLILIILDALPLDFKVHDSVLVALIAGSLGGQVIFLFLLGKLRSD